MNQDVFEERINRILLTPLLVSAFIIHLFYKNHGLRKPTAYSLLKKN